MNKYIAALCVFGLASCVAPGEPENVAPPIAESYFFTQSNEVQYTYSLDNQNVSDTSTYQVVVNGNNGEYSRLSKLEDGKVDYSNNLYYFKPSFNRDGILECILSKKNSTEESVIALMGELTIGSTWIANTTGTITATVEDHYDFYYLIGREKKYDDVVVVKYVDTREAEGTYILRYFANGYGLIHEKRITGDGTGPTTEVSNLRLLERRSLDGSVVTPRPNRWWDAHSRYSIAPALDVEEEY